MQVELSTDIAILTSCHAMPQCKPYSQSHRQVRKEMHNSICSCRFQYIYLLIVKHKPLYLIHIHFQKNTFQENLDKYLSYFLTFMYLTFYPNLFHTSLFFCCVVEIDSASEVKHRGLDVSPHRSGSFMHYGRHER